MTQQRQPRDPGLDRPTTTSSVTSSLTDGWSQRLTAAYRQRRGEGQDFLLVNVGDSIATGRLGITSKSQHYAALAAGLVGGSLGIPARSPVRAPEDFPPGASGAVDLQIGSGGLYGGGSYVLGGGDGEQLALLPQPGYRGVQVCHSGGLAFSTDGGTTWSMSASAPDAAVQRCEIVGESHRVLVRAAPSSGCRILWVRSAHPDEAAIAWYTSGIGATRTPDLHRTLSGDDDAGYRAYGALAPDLLLLAIGVNDTIHADVETIGGSRRALRAVVRRFRDHGVANLALVGPVPVRADFQPGPWRVDDAYREIHRPVATEEDVPLLDWSARWQDHRSAFDAGLLADQVHPSEAGHRDAAAMVADLVLPLLAEAAT